MTEQSKKVEPEQKVVVGLGNPGCEYEMTRHNLGAMAVCKLAEELGLQFKKESRFESLVACGVVESVKVNLLLPLTYMNESGRAVEKFLAFYKLNAKDLIVAVDDIALPFGEMRVRATGSPGGHNGLKSIERHLGTKHYIRLRLGIDKQAEYMDQVDYVLGRFTAAEKKLLTGYTSQAATCLKRLLIENLHRVQSDINRKILTVGDAE